MLSGNSRFFCAEYCLWCLLALAWSWDAAELLHLSKRRGDVVMHSGLLLGALGLLLFNLVHEIPHFFVAKISEELFVRRIFVYFRFMKKRTLKSLSIFCSFQTKDK